MSSLQTSSSWISKNVIDWTCDEVQEWIASTDLPPRNTKQIIQTIRKQKTCGRDIYATNTNSFPGVNNRYGTHLYKALQTVKEENDDILPAKFKRVHKKRGVLQANLPKSARDDGIEILNRNIAKLEHIQNKTDKTTAKDLKNVTTQLKEITKSGNKATDGYKTKLKPISRRLDERSIVKCIGEVIIRPTKAATDADEMGSGTGTAFRKLNHGYIAILTCAHNVIDDDNEPYYKIWFDPDPSSHEYTAMICVAWYYPNDRYEMKYDVNQKHSQYDMAILICKDKDNWFESIDLNDEIHVVDSNDKTIPCEIFGYPTKWNTDETHGQMYGMSGDAEVNDKHDKYEYEIETWPGCSGAPIFAANIDELHHSDENTQMRYMFKETRFTRYKSQEKSTGDHLLEREYSDDEAEDDLYDANESKFRFNLYGIHIYGDPVTQHNIGVKLDTDKKKWITNHIEGVSRIIKREYERYARSNRKQRKHIEKATKTALKEWKFVSFWICEYCGYTNQRLMVGGVWKLYNRSDFCGLCSEMKVKKSSLLLASDAPNQRAKWRQDKDETKPQPGLQRQESSYQSTFVPTEATRHDTRYETKLRYEYDGVDQASIKKWMTENTDSNIDSQYPVYGTGFSMQYHELEPQHSTLKEQILSHEMDEKADPEEVWNIQLSQAKGKASDKYGRACKTDKRYGIQLDEQMHIENVISIAIYCDLTGLCTAFRKSYRKLDNKDTNETIKKRHIAGFYWMGRFIKSAIEFWGEIIEKPGKRHAPFYVGLDIRCLFNRFSATYQIPTSTTYSLEVAFVFAQQNDGGIILELGPKFKPEIHASKCINTMGFSRYGGEKERLIAGTAILTIINIRDLRGKKDYRLIIKSILYFERITEQTADRKPHYNYGKLSIKYQRLYLVPLLKYQMQNDKEYPLDEYDEFIVYDPYICAVFKHFCDRQWKIDLSCLNEEFIEMDPYLRHILFVRISQTEYEVNMNNIKKIFPKAILWKEPAESYINRGGIDIMWIDPTQDYRSRSAPKRWPGDGADLYESRDVISFKWDKDITKKRDCDTIYMLYLLQVALEEIRADIHTRNKYFKRIYRPDLYISHLDAPQIITNLFEWHRKDKRNNKFDGELVTAAPEAYLINEVICKIGRVKLDTATKIVIKLSETTVDYVLGDYEMKRIRTRGYNYGLEACTVEEIITLLTYVSPLEDIAYGNNDKKEVVTGIFDSAERKNNERIKNGKRSRPLFTQNNWKQKVVKYFHDNNIDGKAIMDRSSHKHLTTDMRAQQFDDIKKLTGSLKGIFGGLSRCNVYWILEAAAK
eukprot:541572_1